MNCGIPPPPVLARELTNPGIPEKTTHVGHVNEEMAVLLLHEGDAEGGKLRPVGHPEIPVHPS